MPTSKATTPARNESRSDRSFWVPACAALFALWAVLAWRAGHQAITHDEALVWHWCLGNDSVNPLSYASPNNHVVYTVLTWASVGALGPSAFALRLPTLLGAAIYLVAALCLVRMWCKSRSCGFLMLGLLTTSPYVLDYLMAARGYGLALGFLFAGIALLERDLRIPRHRHAWFAGVALGLSGASQITFSPAIAGVVLAYGFELFARNFDRDRLLRGLSFGFAVTATFGLVNLPLLHSRSGIVVALGPASWIEAFAQQARAHLDHASSSALSASAGLWNLEAWQTPLGFAVPTLMGLLIWIAFRSHSSAGCAPRPVGIALALSVGTAIVLYTITDLRESSTGYPRPRYTVWFGPLIFASLAAGIEGAGVRWHRRLCSFASLALVLLFALQFQTYRLHDFPNDAGARELLAAAEAHAEKHGIEQPRIGMDSAYLQPALEFERQARSSSIAPIERALVQDLANFDYLVLHPNADEEQLRAKAEIVTRSRYSGHWLVAIDGAGTAAEEE